MFILLKNESLIRYYLIKFNILYLIKKLKANYCNDD